MASQETPEMAQKTAQTTTVPVAPAPAHSLPQELAAAGYQPYYQPYPGQPTVAPTPAESTKGAYTRLGFHGVVVVLGAIGLGVSLSSLGGDEGYGIGAAAAPGAAACLAWSLAELITRAVRKWKAGIHPGAHVGICLILWLLTAIMGGSLSAFVALNDVSDRDEENCIVNTYDRYGNLHTYDECDDYYVHYPRGKALGGAVITCMLFAIEFGLFVDACVRTHRRNTAKARPVMVIAQPQNWGPATQGWQPMRNEASTDGVQMPPAAAAAAGARGQEPVKEYYAPA
ncbi:uncharacterized protein TRIREDRAFT_119806 [Trichoderma reesei QM6a]|uniref:Predicted protein n=2 Tax=Hypocrea jecorina TaxID=51453 RepID=G0R8S2_HYPJQ|nr:uncharacterized protein TRIREDRAFT_119806 [Trichoderma reesei QM6a]EGR52936.1 predicted protein [Trichoderma reesei QM6a]ETS06783.1 hypothetical protein M419DRAFT_139834 [Trichoderma reesei RUT C-30]